MKRYGAFMLLILIISLSMTSCLTQSQVSKNNSTQIKTEETTIYYTGVEGARLYPEPRKTSTYITLPSNEKVLRSKVERGFAYVRVVNSGQTGWVDNAQLAWRKKQEASSTAGKQEEKPAREEPIKAAQPETVQEPPKDNSLMKALSPSEAEAATVTPEKKPQPGTKKPDASIFNSF